MKVGYIRVSHVDQNIERQLNDVELDKKFIDQCSGKNIDRPQFKIMMEFIREGDLLIVHSMDRLSRNLDDLRRTVQILTKKGVTVKFIKENLEFTGKDSPLSLLMLSMMGAFAEFDRSLNKERQREGIELAKKRGVYRGRPSKVAVDQIHEMIQRSRQGEKIVKIAQSMNVSIQTIYGYIRRDKSKGKQ